MKKATITLKLPEQTLDLSNDNIDNIHSFIELLQTFKISYHLTYLGEHAQ